MAIAQGTIITVFVYQIFIFILLYYKKPNVIKMVGSLMFGIGFGLILPTATNDTEYGVAIAGMLLSLGLMILNLITPSKKVKKGHLPW